MISEVKLALFAPRGKNLSAHAAALEAARQQSTVNTLERLACFMGQVFVETGGFAVMEENLNYRDPARLDAIFSAVHGIEDARGLILQGPEAIANRVYANRLGNGDEASGDGWRYRGSGYKQLTGRANYRAIGGKIGMALEDHPEQAREPSAAARVAFAFWDARGCSPLADFGDVGAITERINGPARLGLDERAAQTERARGIFG